MIGFFGSIFLDVIIKSIRYKSFFFYVIDDYKKFIEKFRLFFE